MVWVQEKRHCIKHGKQLGLSAKSRLNFALADEALYRA